MYRCQSYIWFQVCCVMHMSSYCCILLECITLHCPVDCLGVRSTSCLGNRMSTHSMEHWVYVTKFSKINRGGNCHIHVPPFFSQHVLFSSMDSKVLNVWEYVCIHFKWF